MLFTTSRTSVRTHLFLPARDPTHQSPQCIHLADVFVSPTATKAFEITVAAAEPKVISEQGIVIGSQISFKEAYERLEDFDVLVIVGGNSAAVLKDELQPSGIIAEFAELQKRDPGRERTILSVCTGSLFLAKENILSGLSATTHPDYITKFENLCSDAATRNLTERTDVVEDARYVVNNLRFDLGDEDENPYIRRKSDTTRRPSVGAR
jgi:transcriptional regulator GlxA family with amidase domain